MQVESAGVTIMIDDFIELEEISTPLENTRTHLGVQRSENVDTDDQANNIYKRFTIQC